MWRRDKINDVRKVHDKCRNWAKENYRVARVEDDPQVALLHEVKADAYRQVASELWVLLDNWKNL